MFRNRGIFIADIREIMRGKVCKLIEKIKDIKYREVNGMSLLLDIVKPSDSYGPYPAIIYIHGGGWMSGDKSREDEDSWDTLFAASGFVCININYRLSHQDPFPAQIQDVKAAIRWVKANAKKYDINPEKIGIWGHSSGGHLASLAGTSSGVGTLEDDNGNQGNTSEVNAVVSIAGPSDLLKMGGWHDLPNSPESKFIGGPLTSNTETARKANPIIYIGQNPPPFLIIHGDTDGIVPISQGELLYKSLPNASFLTIKGADHNLVGGNLTFEDILITVKVFFERHLKKSLPGSETLAKHRKEMAQVIEYFKAGN